MVCVVKLWKLLESEDCVAYLYGPDREHIGRLVLDKKTGAISGDKTVPGNCFFHAWFYYGALAKTRAEKMFKAREYPDEAYMGT
jgi:hypothetical protein